MDGNVLAVGCVSGKWLIFDTQTRELLGQYADGAEPISVIQFSPDGSMLALGSRDNHIYIYEVTDESHRYSRIGRCMVRHFIILMCCVFFLYHCVIALFYCDDCCTLLRAQIKRIELNNW